MRTRPRDPILNERDGGIILALLLGALLLSGCMSARPPDRLYDHLELRLLVLYHARYNQHDYTYEKWESMWGGETLHVQRKDGYPEIGILIGEDGTHEVWQRGTATTLSDRTVWDRGAAEKLIESMVQQATKKSEAL